MKDRKKNTKINLSKSTPNYMTKDEIDMVNFLYLVADGKLTYEEIQKIKKAKGWG